MKNGLIHVIEGEQFPDNSSINTEIVRLMQNGENVTVYTESLENTSDNESMENLNSIDNLPTNSEEEIVGKLLENRDERPKKVIIVVTSTDNPLPLPS
jgi:macrodomain Ter protein organizer (MatP/YcbG family)